MRNNLFFTSSIAWLAFLGICLVIFQLVKAQMMPPATPSLPESKSISTTVRSSDFFSAPNDLTPTINFASHECLDFSILPDLEETKATKEFFKNIHFLGYIGRHGAFQSNLSDLSVRQLMANFLLKPEGIVAMNTVQVTPNMLTMEQLKACYIFAHILQKDLNAMYSFTTCTDEQIDVINTVLGRLTYLRVIFKKELVANDSFEDALDSNSITMDFLENSLQATNNHL